MISFREDGLELAEKLIKSNSLDFELGKEPLIIVLRNTHIENNTYKYDEDTGNNNCDTILLIDEDCNAITGRSYPNDHYQRKMVQKKSRANYIETSFVYHAWRKGKHLRKYKALVQNRNFMVKRSIDMELRDDDDYMEYSFPCDNFHGSAPNSAGCVTVEGSMRKIAGDWKHAYDWIYSKHSNDTYFSALILFNEDINYALRETECLRYGSRGPKVEEVQKKLNLKVDGDYGPVTYEKVNEVFDVDYLIDYKTYLD